MPHFFFNLRDGDHLIHDPEGSVLPDIETARDVARKSARDILIARLQEGKEADGSTIEITDPEGRVIEVLRLADVLKPGN